MRKLYLIPLLFTVLFSTLPSQAQTVSPSIGMSGSFYSYDNIVLVPGGVLNSSEVYIVVYNYGDRPLPVELRYSAPPGFEVEFLGWGENPRILEPGEHVRVQVVVRVSEDVLPGQYRIGVYADVKLNESGGIVVVPGAGQEITVNVVGEYSTLHVYALDPAGREAREAIVRVYGTLRGGFKAVAEGRGEVHTRLVPGTYRVVVYLSGEEAASANVTLEAFEEKTLNLTLRVVYFERFSVQPQTDSKGHLLAARVNMVLKNLYKTITDARIVLEVYRDGMLVEERVVQEASILPKGRVEHRFDYVPPGGWESGNYTFIAKVYGLGGRLLAESEPVWLYYKAPMPLYLVIIPVIVVIVIAYLLARRRKSRRGRSGKPRPS